jgi:hypothetical protein
MHRAAAERMFGKRGPEYYPVWACAIISGRHYTQCTTGTRSIPTGRPGSPTRQTTASCRRATSPKSTPHLAGSAEIAVVTFRETETARARRLATTPPTASAAWSLPDTFEIRIVTSQGGATLVGAIELVNQATT